MFCKLSLLALVAPLVHALTLNIPENPTSGGQITITWAFANSDPAAFSFELTNEVFHNTFAIANNVVPEAQTLTLTLPIVPVGAGYTLAAVNIGDVNDVFASTGQFSIGPNGATSVSSVSQTSSSASSSVTSVKSSSATKTTTLSLSASTNTVSSSSTAFGVTVSASTTSSTGASAASASGAAPASSSASTFNGNNGAGSNFKGGNMGTIAAALLSAVAGAAIIVL
ncbi:hypothetical protein C0991_001518 [Blastosporella zonata]|nr:hypothetical protein C0991_001518 [Blastosporella zonata]